MKKFRTVQDRYTAPGRYLPRSSELMKFTHSLTVGMFVLTWGLIVALNFRLLTQ